MFVKEYQKINTLFKRDERNVIIPEELSQAEFGFLKNCKWEATEKIDGTNIRVIITPHYEISHFENIDKFAQKFEGFKVEFRGKTDNAHIPSKLVARLMYLFTPEKVMEVFGDRYKQPDENGVWNNSTIILFGEGYGAGIQKGGNYLPKDQDFILFDVAVDNWWLERENIEEIAKDFNIKVVPIMGYFTLEEAINFVSKGFKSVIAENENYDAEGLVLKPFVQLFDRKGNRIVTKIKTKDFRKYEQSKK